MNANSRIVNKISKGTILTCPKDNKAIIEVKKDITLYSNIDFSNFNLLEKFPPEIENTIPCEVIKSLCFHIDNEWIGFSKECSLIPYNSGKYTFKEFINMKIKINKDRDSIIDQQMSCLPYKESKEFNICITKDKKWKCIQSKIYNTKNNIGPCTENTL